MEVPKREGRSSFGVGVAVFVALLVVGAGIGPSIGGARPIGRQDIGEDAPVSVIGDDRGEVPRARITLDREGFEARDGTDRSAAGGAKNRTVTIASGVKGRNRTLEILVRLESASVTPELGDDRAVTALKRHARSSQAAVLEFVRGREGARVLNRFWLVNAVLLRVNTSRVPIRRLANVRSVVAIHPNYAVSLPEPRVDRSPSATNGTGSVNTTYGVRQVNAPAVWRRFDTRGEGVKVAVLDTGVDITHPDIELYTTDPGDPTYPGGWAAFDGRGNRIPGSKPHADGGHGTHVSGIVSGGNASGEYIGVAPNVQLLHAQVLPNGTGTMAQTIAGMQWAVKRDADVISMSLGVGFFAKVYIAAVRNAGAAGTLVVAAAGNSGEGSVATPGAVYEALAVGASTQGREIAAFSSGATVDTVEDWVRSGRAGIWPDTFVIPSTWPTRYVVPDVAAPGVGIKSSVPGGGYRELSGTSMATPYVAGVAALTIAAAEEEPSPYTIQSALMQTATKPSGAPPGEDTRYGHGIVDALAATKLVVNRSRVRGVVTDRRGNPISGARVAAANGGFDITDEQGRYSVLAGSGRTRLTVEAWGYTEWTISVTVPAGSTVVKRIALGEAVDITHVTSMVGDARSGEGVSQHMRVTNVRTMRVSFAAESTVDPDDATVSVNGQPIEVGQPVRFEEPLPTTDLTIRVAFDGNATGVVQLRYTFAGGDQTVTARSRVLTLPEEATRVGLVIVSGEDSQHAAPMARTLERTLPADYGVDVVPAAGAVAAADEYDAFVVQSIGTADRMGAFLNATDAGIVFLDNWAGTFRITDPAAMADGITRLSQATGNPASVLEADATQTPTGIVQYELLANHSLFRGVGSAGDTVIVYRPSFDDRAWFTGYNGTVLARVGTPAETNGPSVAVNATRRHVLLTLGREEFVPNSVFTDAGNRLLANAVVYAAGGTPGRAGSSIGVSDVRANETVTQGGRVVVAGTLTNTGSGGAVTVEYRLDRNGDGTLAPEEAVAFRRVSLAANESRTVTFTHRIGLDLAAGTYRHGVFAAADNVTADIRVRGAFSSAIPGTNAEGPPTDPDGDGLFEDVDGDGDADFDDALALAFADIDALSDGQIAALDFDGDGDLDFDDAVELAFQV